MHSVLSLLVLALAAQADPAASPAAPDAPVATAPPASVAPSPQQAPALPAPAQPEALAAPAAAEPYDPIGALVNAAQNGEGEDGAPPVAAASAPVQTAPAPPPAAATTTASAEDEEDGAPAPARPTGQTSGPRPYTTLGPGRSGPVRPIQAQPLVRIRPAPQGKLDGGWVLSQARDGAQLYQFQFNDEGGSSEIQGAWRDVQRTGSLVGSGPVSSVGYDGAGALTIRFSERGAQDAAEVTLAQSPQGVWTGELKGRKGATPVVMKRY